MEIRFVGSGDAFGSGGRFQTCIRLHAEGFTALVDCGDTSLTAMKVQQLDPGDVDAVVISHLHGDHFGGLPYLILDGQFAHRTTNLTVSGRPARRAGCTRRWRRRIRARVRCGAASTWRSSSSTAPRARNRLGR